MNIKFVFTVEYILCACDKCEHSSKQYFHFHTYYYIQQNVTNIVNLLTPFSNQPNL